MSTKELRPVCSVGMFDLLKGLQLILIICGHTLQCFPSFVTHHLLSFNISVSCGNLMLWGFIIAAGFGIRKRPIRKCALQLKEAFLLPYVVTGLAASFLFSLNNYFLNSDFSFAVRELLRSLLAFALGHHLVAHYGTFEMLHIGPMWFLVALAGGWFLLNLILQFSQGWKRNLLVLLAGFIGYFGNLLAATYNILVPFCLFFMFEFVLGLYLGYLARVHNWFEKKLSPIAIVLIVVSLAAFAWKYDVRYELYNQSDLPLGIFTPYAAAAVGFGVTYLMTHINRRENPITNFLEAIGNNSIYIFCVHTVEYIGVPWVWFKANLPDASVKHMYCMILILRFTFIALGMLVIKSFQNWGGFARLKEMLFRKKTA